DRNLAVKNVNSHDLGVLGLEKETGMRRRRIMIPRNTTLPARSRSRFVTHRAGQQRVVVHVVEGGDDSGKNSTAIGKCAVTGLPSNLPAKSPVVVQFHYAANGRLSIKASLPNTGKEASMNIERAFGMSDDVLRQWEQRIAAGQYIDPAESKAAAKAAAPAPSDFAAEAPKAPAPAPPEPATENLDFDPPHIFEDDEDSEVFSDLEF
ncbi:MAG: Hsp70 family protein, partial [Pirellulaceae bacterium]|nr:Hsp70 family protein [Pirellulaceae bacterium]